MANEQTDFDFEKYEGAYVAQQYAQAGDFQRAHLALLATPLDDDGRTLLENDPHYEGEEGIKSASIIYGNQFVEPRNERTLEQLREFYDEQISGLSDDARTEAESHFDKYGRKKLGDVQTAYLDALEILKGKSSKAKYKRSLASGGLRGEQLEEVYKKGIKKAEKNVKDYATIVRTIQLLQEKREESIRGDVRDSLLEKILSNGE